MNFQNQIDYLKQFDRSDMLEGVEVPAPLQAETLKTQIVFRCGLLEPQYSEPVIMQTAIAQFFKREQWNITHLVNIILAEYSPIENTDRYSEHTNSTDSKRTVTSTGSGTDTHSGTDKRSVEHSGKDQRDESHSGTDEREETHSGTDEREEQHSGTDERDEQHSGTDSTTNTVSAFNSSAYQPDSKSDVLNGHKIDDDLSYGHKINDDTTYGHKINDDTTYGHKIDDDLTYGHKIEDDVTYGHKIAKSDSRSTTDSGTGSDTYTEHTHGNIGVTTNQEMINQELELLRHFDIYDWIAAKLENELFIQVY